MQNSSENEVKRRVKIVCTLGPATQSIEMLQSLIVEGMDVARLNFSHGTPDDHRAMVKKIRDAAKQQKKHIGVMQDLQGPKIRVGSLPESGIMLKAGDIVLLYPEGSTPKKSSKGKILIPISAEIAEAISKDVGKGMRILFDDGLISSVVKEVSVPEIVIEVTVGGVLKSHKGLNLPDAPLSLPCCTEKDLRDLKVGLELGVDAVALSFVRSEKDIEDLRTRIQKQTNDVPLLVSKIERREAVESYESIIDVSDVLLIARGDMAVELGVDRVPTIQKQLIRACNSLGVPVITATQMLESMRTSPTPTRAEASDVANAVFDGTDAVMLSAETASGLYPIEAVKTMCRIVHEAERWTELYSVHTPVQPMPGSVVDSIEYSAAKVAHHVGAVVIACLTHSGMAARTLSKYRPDKPIVAIMDREGSLRKLAFVWGVEGVLIPKIVGTDNLFRMVEDVLQKNGLAQDGDLILVTAGVPTLRRGTTNMIKVHRVGSNDAR